MEIKEMMQNMERQMEVGTARGRAKVDGRAISLEPHKDQIEHETKQRIDIYLCTAREMAGHIRNVRAGMSPDELESVEFIREQMIDLAKKVSNQMIDKAMEE